MNITLDCTELYQSYKKTCPNCLDFSPILSCEVIFSSRKTMAIQIERDGRITLRAPFHTEKESLEAFLDRQRKWVLTHYLKQLERLRTSATQGIGANGFQSGDVLRLYDWQITLKINRIPSGSRASIDYKENFLIINTPSLSPDFLSQCIGTWYKKNGKAILIRRANFWAERMAVSYRNITLKEQKTRWGSCSALGNLNFNWKLLLMDPRLLDYVVVHELAHLREMNHSPAFWKIVETYIPDYKERRRALKSLPTL